MGTVLKASVKMKTGSIILLNTVGGRISATVIGGPALGDAISSAEEN